ncbi:hypothetical protein [Parasitella parasitica]|uniref:Uncharacterized protein n=1 Tax=Parasitella parasitica TaxID=35722 RepID=A0A0B7NXE8_9FUNG|nr:hypothetical protein [Parasitella parasitica]
MRKSNPKIEVKLLTFAIGTLNVSAYSFDDSNNAFASVRVGVNQVSPIREVDADGRLVGTELANGCVSVNETSFPTSMEDRKCRFIVMKYVLDNWSNDKLVDGKKDSLNEAFSDNLKDLYKDLGVIDLESIPNRFNPISVQEVTAVKRLKKNNSSSRTVRKVAVRVPNPAFRTSDMLSPHLILTELANDEIRFNVRLFNIPPPPPLNQQETAKKPVSSQSKTDSNNEDRNVLEETKSFNYRERCAISPIKLMTQIKRKSNSTKDVIGHYYEVSEAIGIKHNFEFAEMAYGSTLGLYYRRGDPEIINKRKVTAAYEAQEIVHPLLRRYELAPLMRSLLSH